MKAARSRSNFNEGPSTRTAGRVNSRLAKAAIVGAALAIVGNTLVLLAEPDAASGTVSYPLTPDDFRLGQVFFALTQAGMTLGMVALARTAVSRRTRPAKVGANLAVIGFVITVAGELVLALVADAATDSGRVNAASSVYGIGILLADLGLIMLGLSALRAASQRRTGAVLLLLLGIFQLAVVTPVSFAAGFASLGSYLVIALQDLLIAMVGLAMIQRLFDGRGEPAVEWDHGGEVMTAG